MLKKISKYKSIFIVICALYSVQVLAFSSSIQILKAHEHKDLQELVDDSLITIFKSNLAKEIAYKIMHCNIDAIENHLGVTRSAAQKIQSYCSEFRPSNYNLNYDISPIVQTSPLKALSKTVDLKKVSLGHKRSYSFLLTDNNDWKLDSWTDPATNSTSIIINSRGEDLKKELPRIIEILAHETAIYFDAKFWAGSTQFTSLPDAKEFLNEFNTSHELITLALDNPLIANSMAFLRAFKVEQLITSELIKKRLLVFNISDIARRNEKIGSFLTCKALCLHDFLEAQIKFEQDMSLPLMAYASGYRTKLWTYISNNAFALSSNFELPKSTKLKEMLISLPNDFYMKHKDLSIHLIFESMANQVEMNKHNTNIDIFNELLVNGILRQHLNDLKNQKNVMSQHSALEFMTKPLLSGDNVRMSSGPRPRIIIGGF
ncbi:MAG: hypothetical protein KDD58_10145 [Bdellovibrionales bacterium]|nr:hypothetical protein [Bdellovibrionales bacterium]